MEGKWQVTIWTERLPAAVFADCEWGGAATIVKDKALEAVFEVFGDII